MNIKELFTEDRGVSPVIGVILMVAITVILAAVIGAFVLGLGDQASNNAPQASIGFAFEGDDTVTLSHEGGENIDNTTIDVTVDGTTLYNSTGLNEGVLDTDGSENGWTDPISTGKELRLVIDEDADVDTTGNTVRVIWNNPSGGSSNTIADRRWP